MENRIKIAVADDHKMFRQSLTMLLSQEEDLDIVCEAADGMELIKNIADLNGDVDIVLLDISMPKLSGLDAISEIKNTAKDAKIICLTMHKSEEYIADAFNSGVSGYILKENAFEELISAIHQVYGGEVYISPVIAPQLLSGFLENGKQQGELSSREREIMKLLAEGYSNKEIADFLCISVRTVETHRANIMRKHNFRSITDLVLYAVRNHIIEV